jgi:mannose-6-phosphate isomerase
MTDFTKPIKLNKASAWRTYAGGSLIAKLHGQDKKDDNFPEEWIMSTVRARNSGREDIVEGLSMVSGSEKSLRDILHEDPVAALGEKHFARYGESLGVLVKLLDAAERLTIQVHPTREKARALFDSAFGKTECWHIIDSREIDGEKPCIYFGFKEGVTRERWKQVFDEQDIPAMLDCLHKFEVKTGDTFLIEGGIPHAIGAGCFLVEIQEPTDYTIRTERITPKGLEVADVMCHQGLGFDRMFDCFEYDGASAEAIIEKQGLKKRGRTIVGYEDTEMFALECIELDGGETFTSGGVFSGIYVLDGDGTLDGDPIRTCDQFFIPAACESFELCGKMKVLRFYGPKITDKE